MEEASGPAAPAVPEPIRFSPKKDGLPKTFTYTLEKRVSGIVVDGRDEAAMPSPRCGSMPPLVDPEDFGAPPGQLIPINRSTPPSPADVYRCAGCVKAECQGPTGCTDFQWRDQSGGYLREILTSRVYSVARETPLERAPGISDAIGCNLYLKREDMQPVHSFKIRGAFNRMARLTPEQLKRGVICSSAGNHAQGVAMSAAHLGCSAVICMPTNSPEIKYQAVERLGGTVELVGESFYETAAHAVARGIAEGRTFINAYDDPYCIAGQGTAGAEILRQGDIDKMDYIFVAVGGGGLIAGIAAVVKALKPSIKIIGVEPTGANSMTQSLVRGERVTLSKVDAFADGVAIKLVGAEAFRLCRELLDGMLLEVFNETRSILEPAGAVAVAGALAFASRYRLRGKTLVAVTSGANMNFDRLRIVSELANVGSAETMLATALPDEPGSLLRLMDILSGNSGPLNITEFKYRYNMHSDGLARMLFSVGEAPGSKESRALMARAQAAGIRVQDVSDVELAQTHLRHMIAGLGGNVTYPERVGMLRKLLTPLSPRWTISLVHFRKTGNRSSTLMLGVQLKPEEMAEFLEATESLSGEFVFEPLLGRAKQVFDLFLEK
ncbi:Threonine dehydratase biosynthetic, chloroplastic [Auxenochlorella protothecoides]|uniref:Threonine dehydratase n=1 Tax=Auxenochlorella protothecoides TaxID=3075 RepID=A0A087SL62_AUXPR|nr:Threonine dehydratase biosynthetic, chloroplastic [Auxenochlorella protothecoides]KFM26466.1 Threonine dehydratase biosynthetic, chloroplastic [Auxenochlorella protothecoides]RMZ56542.1 hypothetical protein APUTEX25_001389 [Auxenochlorella protothecoides]|eukprot:RMZ56542.1 hypothetical protein APUTEX25_001389 [Auxenochlorella protothecoides]